MAVLARLKSYGDLRLRVRYSKYLLADLVSIKI